MKNKALTIVASVVLVLVVLAVFAGFSSLGKGGDSDHTHTYRTVGNSATCTAAGEKLEICSVCQEERKTAVPALGHDYRVTSHVDATCDADGLHVETCSRCKDVKSTTIAKLVHVFELDRESSSTCTEGGERVEICTLCGAERKTSFEAVAHELESHAAVAATCTETGHDAYEACKNCSYTTRGEDIPALGHDEVAHEAQASTCTVAGHNAYVTCSRCSYTTYQALPLGAHTYAEGVCTVCGAIEEASEGCATIIINITGSTIDGLNEAMTAGGAGGVLSWNGETISSSGHSVTISVTEDGTLTLPEGKASGATVEYTLDGDTTLSAGETLTITITVTGGYEGSDKCAFDTVNVTFASNLISFTIDGATYQAEAGMTWGEWVESDYNTLGFSAVENVADGVVERPADYGEGNSYYYVVGSDSHAGVSLSEEITEGFEYYTDYSGNLAA